MEVKNPEVQTELGSFTLEQITRRTALMYKRELGVLLEFSDRHRSSSDSPFIEWSYC